MVFLFFPFLRWFYIALSTTGGGVFFSKFRAFKVACDLQISNLRSESFEIFPEAYPSRKETATISSYLDIVSTCPQDLALILGDPLVQVSKVPTPQQNQKGDSKKDIIDSNHFLGNEKFWRIP